MTAEQSQLLNHLPGAKVFLWCLCTSCAALTVTAAVQLDSEFASSGSDGRRWSSSESPQTLGKSHSINDRLTLFLRLPVRRRERESTCWLPLCRATVLRLRLSPTAFVHILALLLLSRLFLMSEEHGHLFAICASLYETFFNFIKSSDTRRKSDLHWALTRNQVICLQWPVGLSLSQVPTCQLPTTVKLELQFKSITQRLSLCDTH